MGACQVWSSAVVQRPIDEVWAIVSDAPRFKQWCKLFWFEGGDFARDKKLRLVLPAGPVRVRVPVRVTQFEHENEVRWDAGFGGFHGSHWIKMFSLSSNETQISHGEDFRGLRWVWPYVRQEVHNEYQKVTDDLVAYILAQ